MLTHNKRVRNLTKEDVPGFGSVPTTTTRVRSFPQRRLWQCLHVRLWQRRHTEREHARFTSAQHIATCMMNNTCLHAKEGCVLTVLNGESRFRLEGRFLMEEWRNG